MNTLNQDLLGSSQKDPPTRGASIRNNRDAVKRAALADYVEGTVVEPQIREIYIDPTFWNTIKLYLVNIYEVTLICIGLALSIYEDDIASLVLQLIMQVLLALALKEMGKYAKLQRNISIIILVIATLSLIAKIVVAEMIKANLTELLPTIEIDLVSFGYETITNATTGEVTFDTFECYIFEVLVILLCICLVHYYQGIIPKKDIVEPIGYLHNSLWFNHYMKLYYMFFFLIACDTFFAQNLTQLSVLCFMIIIMYLWAFDYHNKNQIIKWAVVWSQRLYIVQIAFLAFTQIGYVIQPIKSNQTLYDIMYAWGLILNNSDLLLAALHVFNICAIMGFGCLYETCYANSILYKEQRGDIMSAGGLGGLTTKLLATSKKLKAKKSVDQQEDATDGPSMNASEKEKMTEAPQPQQVSQADKKHKKSKPINFQHYIDNYAPYIYIWICRLFLLVQAYYYHSYPAFLILTWILLSFMVPLAQFVSFTVILFTPLYTITFVLIYFINIPGVISNTALSYITADPNNRYWQCRFQFPYIETALFTFIIGFLVLLIPTRYILRLQRDEFRMAIFMKLTEKESVFLWQILFYTLKRLHIFILCFIFIFGMQEINIYYIGLLFFSIIFATSLNTYREYGNILVGYSAFFIWISYFWSLTGKLIGSGIIFNVFSMITFSKVVESNDGINQYMDYNIPIWTWTMFFLFVIMATVNYCFRKDKKITRQAFENADKLVIYQSTGEYYEAKCDYTLKRKFPKTQRLLNRIVYIFSNMMILVILLTQGFLLAFQPPSILFWGFLILSLTLQRIVVCAGDEDPKIYKKCARQSRILKWYCMFVIILQVVYHFCNDEAFLKPYGFDQVVHNFLNQIGAIQYLDFIGLENLSNSNIMVKFISQIAFYVMAVILEDYFVDQIIRMEAEAEVQRGLANSFLTLRTARRSQIQQETDRGLDQSNSGFAEGEDALDVEDRERLDEREKVEWAFEHVRFTIPFMIYKWMGAWKVLDEVALNFHLVTATVTIAFCIYFQISLFFCFYLICTVILCIRAAFAQKSQVNVNIKKEMNVNEAHACNKQYMREASTNLLRVRVKQWNIQYWLVIASMIIMYPTPFFERFKVRRPEMAAGTTNVIFWMFWSGVYVSPEDIASYGTYAPYYCLIMVLIFEKYAQRWQDNRLQCTMDKVRHFKKVEEQLELVRKKEKAEPINATSEVQQVVRDDSYQFVTYGEAKQECDRIESLYRKQTNKVKEARYKQIITLGVQRKYNTQVRNAMKVGMEQVSLFLLLISAAYKSNIISIVYMFVLLAFLLTNNKTKGMKIMLVMIGIILILQYIAVLLNLTSLTSPYAFPPEFIPYPDPNSANSSAGQYIIPLYLKGEFLSQNLIWTNFLGFDIEKATLNKIWFDFANLALMTIYFFAYGNPINANNVKVSFSSTFSLEKAVNDYARIQVSRKAKAKIAEANIYDDEEEQVNESIEDSKQKLIEKDLNQSFSDIAADDSQEYFLGATYYLTQIKQGIFLYYFTKKARCFFFIGWQIVTLIAIFLLAFLCKSFMSIGYLIACVPLILFVCDFFKQEQLSFAGETWKHPHFICGPIMIFSFIDIAIQILVQVPVVDGTSQLLQWFGFEKIWVISPTLTYADLYDPNHIFYLNSEQLKFLILKSLNLFFIFLQSRIYESTSFKKYLKNDLRKLLTLAKNYKRISITMRFNNWKLQQIVASQDNIKKMYKGVAELKLKIRTWQSLILGGLAQQSDKMKADQLSLTKDNNSLKTPLLKTYSEETKQLEQEQSSLLQQKQQQEEENQDKSSKKHVMFKSMSTNVFKSIVKGMNEQQEEQKEKDKMLKEQKAKLPRCARIYLCLQRKRINPIFFLTEVEECSMVRKDMSFGKRKILTQLENEMIHDINLYYLKLKPKLALKKKSISSNKNKKQKLKDLAEIQDYRIDQMPRTSSFISFSNIIQSVFYSFLQALASNLSALAYLFMILSQIVSGGLITIIYPFSVFGYALMEEGRPGRWFWEFMIKYTLFILFMKFIFQLNCWDQYPNAMINYDNVNAWILTGLWKVRTGTWFLFLYILPEIGILLCVMGQQFYEHLNGLYDTREIEIEDIEKARERLLATAAGKKDMGTTFVYKQKEADKAIVEMDEFLDLIKAFPSDYAVEKKKIEIDDYLEDYSVFTTNPSVLKRKDEFKQDVQDHMPDRRYTLLADRLQLHETVKEIKAERKRQRKQGFIKSNFSKKAYFQRLFPLIKEQKPGMDLYAWITFVQFGICIYLISYYTYIDTEGTQNLEQSSQFSINMVMVLFIQIAVMIIERYVNRTNPRHVVKKIGSKQNEDDCLNDDQLLAQMKLEDAPRSLSIRVDYTQMGDTLLQNQLVTDKSKTKVEIPKIILVKTKMTLQQVTKFIVQWCLMLIYHVLVFWYYPINSNYVIYGTPTCNPDSKAYSSYGCLSFHQNAALICFYLLFCLYFTLSAMQIRYGLPDYRAGSSLMKERNNLYRYIWLIFYNIPFLMELKTILDWCFTKTGLDLMEWLQISQFNSEMFLANISGKYTYLKKFGEKISRCEKCICGCSCVGLILFFLVGPFLMFSNLSFISSYNLVTDAQVQLGVKIIDNDHQETYQFPLYTATSALSVETMTEFDYNNRTFDKIPETKFFHYDQVQYIKIKNASETTWQLSNDYRDQFQGLLDEAQYQTGNITIEITLTCEFERPGPELAQVARNVTNITLDSKRISDSDIISQLSKAADMQNNICILNPNATQSIVLEDFLITKLRLGEKTTINPVLEEFQDVTLTYSCENFWSINIDDKGITVLTFSDLISSGFFSATSIMGFYMGVALIVGQTFRSMFIYKGDRVFICDSPNTGAILNLIKCIYIARIERNIKKEEELFHVLLEVLRSPELLKHIAGTSLRAPL